jgi:hypothetical protein
MRAHQPAASGSAGDCQQNLMKRSFRLAFPLAILVRVCASTSSEVSPGF